MKFELKTRQVCFFLITFIPINKMFILPSILSATCGADLWIACSISIMIDLITISFVILTCKRAKTDFFTLLENGLGKIGAKTILSIFLLYFLIKAIIPINEQKEYVELTLYTLKPSIFYFLPFFLVAFYLCLKPLRVIGRASDILWFFTLIGYLVLLFLSITNADFTAILPIGVSGANKIFNGSIKSFNWFGDGAYLLFFIGEFYYKKRDGIKIILSYIVSALMILSFMIIFYCIFTSIAHRQRFAFTEISKYTTVINNLGRFDYIGIVLMIFSNTFSICLPLYFACRILNYIFQTERKWITSLCVVGIEAIILLGLSRFYATIENLATGVLSIFFFLMGNLLPTLSSLLTLKKENYENT